MINNSQNFLLKNFVEDVCFQVINDTLSRQSVYLLIFSKLKQASV